MPTDPPQCPDPVDHDLVIAVLRRHGARFAFRHGSRVHGGCAQVRPTARSDVDVAAWFGRRDIDPLTVAAALPAVVDLLILDGAPLEFAGRVALHGALLFDDDPPARVEWQATTRKIYLDERPRVEQARRDFTAAWGWRGRS